MVALLIWPDTATFPVVAPVLDSTIFPDGAPVALLDNRVNNVVLMAPDVGDNEREVFEILVGVVPIKNPFGADTNKLEVRLVAETENDCAADSLPLQAEKGLSVPVTFISGGKLAVPKVKLSIAI